MTHGYTEHDRHRHRELGTPPHHQQRQPSTPFALDRDRIAATAAFERLAGITQIDQPRAGSPAQHRKSHSLTVARLGRHLASSLGTDPDLVEAGCLAHDLGHPPFGHDGERALAVVAASCGGFEANAQTLRILTRHAPLTVDTAAPDGLHLTRATLDSTCKYPWPARNTTANNDSRRNSSANNDSAANATGKFGAYPDDLSTLAWLREGAPPNRRCVEAQIMDWSDDVANAVQDLAYGIRVSRIPVDALLDHSDRVAMARLAAADITTLPLDQVLAAADELAALPVLRHLAELAHTSGTHLDAALSTLTAQLCDRYVHPVIDATLAHHGTATVRRYEADLHVPPWAQAEVAVLTALKLHHVLRMPAHRERRARHMHRIVELAEHVAARAPARLGLRLHAAWRAAPDDAGRLRAVVDHVAGLTDAQAATFTC